MTPKCPDCKRDQDECICSSPVSAPEALDWLETELSAISCSYHGDPSYDHDAYWMRGRVEKLLEEARKLFTAPTPPVSEDRWQPIETAPKETTQMFVVVAFGAKVGATPYNSDPWCVWHQRGEFVRWPHKFSPTHWMQLPEAPTMQEDKL